MNAKEATEILSIGVAGDHMECLKCRATGYLTGMQADEVKELVKALELCFCEHGGLQNVKDALSNYREAVK